MFSRNTGNFNCVQIKLLVWAILETTVCKQIINIESFVLESNARNYLKSK